MIIHVVVPLHRHSLAPKKVAEWMGHMIDPDNDVVRAVTVTDDEGDMLVWRRHELPDSLTAADLPRGVSAEQQARDLLERCGVEDAQSFTAGDVVELANLIDEVEQLRVRTGRPMCCGGGPQWGHAFGCPRCPD